MVLSHLFWTGFFQREFVPQLRAIVEVLEKRTLPAFAGIEQEAEAVADLHDFFLRIAPRRVCQLCKFLFDKADMEPQVI